MNLIDCLKTTGIGPDDVSRLNVLVDSGMDEIDAINQLSTEIETDITDIMDRVEEAGGTVRRPTEPVTLDQAPATDSDAFKEWFGDSKVVDENGEPLVVYHGTNADFSEFDKDTFGKSTDEGWLGEGFYFTSDPSNIDAYGIIGMPVYLKADNLYDMNGQNFNKVLKEHGGNKGFSDWLRSNGYDGATMWSQYMVLEPNQIKSAVGNMGTFDPEDPNILYQSATRKQSAERLGFDTSRVLYHGTGSDVTSFDRTKFGSSTQAFSAKQGVWLVDSPNTARGYAEYAATDVKVQRKIKEAEAAEKKQDWDTYGLKLQEAEQLEKEFQEDYGQGQNIMPIYIRGNLLSVDMGGAEFMDKQKEINRTILSAKRNKYDGVEFNNLADDVGFNARPSTHVVIFEPNNIRSIYAKFDPSRSTEADILAQPGQTDPRGSIEIFDDKHIIRLGNASDLSTFLHEAGHLFLQMERQFAREYGITKDQQAIIDWLGVKSFDDIQVEHHEQFARGFEAYLREGKAPSLGLREAFAAFRRWLTRIYQTLRSLNVQLNDEVREVFDRLLATEAQIEEAAANPAYDQFFRSKEQAGMTDVEWEKYQKRQQRVKDKAQQSLDQVVLKEIRDRKTQEWKEKKQPIYEQQFDTIGKQPVYQILSDTSQWQMDYDIAKEILGFTKQPGRLIGKLKKGGVDPAEYAEAYGYSGPQQMFDAVLNAPTLKQATDTAAEEIMIQQHGDILNDGTIEEEAREVMHNEEQASLLVDELRALRRKTGRGDGINREYLKYEAIKLISNLKYKEIQSGKYYRAEIRAAQKATKATTDQERLEAKTQQLVNHHLYREAVQVKEAMEKQRRYVKRVQTRKYSSRQVAPDFSQNMRVIANLYDLRNNPDRAEAINKILEWYESQIADKNQYVHINLVDPMLVLALEAKKNGQLPSFRVPVFDDLTAGQLKGVYDMLRHLRFVGGKLADEGKAETQAKREAIVKSVIDNGGKDYPLQPGTSRVGKKVKRNFSHMVNKISSLKNMTRRLDDTWGKTDTDGTMFSLIYKLVEEGNSKKLKIHKEMFERFETELKDIHDIKLSKLDAQDYQLESGVSLSLTSEERFMLAAYWGTESSREAIRDGFGMTDVDVMTILSGMTTDQLRVVNTLWRINESMWPELSAATVRLDGVSPPKLDAIPFEINGVKMTGGHMRLIYDSTELELKQEQEEAYLRASVLPTKAGSAHARVGSGGRPVLLDTNNIVRAINDNTHYIAFAEIGSQLQSLLNTDEVRGVIEKKHGPGFHRAFIETIEGVTGNHIERDLVPFVGGMMRLLRRAATFKHLAWSVRNTVQQFSAIPVATEEVGTADYIKHSLAFWSPRTHSEFVQFVQDRSEFMVNRASLVNREAAEYMRQLTVSGKAQYAWLQFARFGFTPQAIVDRTIAYPVWMARYEQAMEVDGTTESEAASLADSAVAESVGSGSDLHLGGLFQQNQSEFIRTFTVFGSWFNAYYQRIYRATKGGQEYLNADTVQAVLTTPIVVGVIAAALIMDGPDGDEEWYEWVMKTWVKFLGGTAPLLRDVVSSFEGFSPKTVWAGGADAPSRLFTEFGQTTEGRQSGIKAASDVGKVVTTLVPVPGAGNILRLMDYTDSYNRGREGEWNTYQALVEGPDRNR